MSYRNAPLGKPVNTDVKYCTVEDVNNFIRGYDLTDNTTEPSTSEVEFFIESATEKIDRQTAVAFQSRKVDAYDIDDDVFTNRQKRKKKSEHVGNNKFTRKGEYKSGSSDRYVTYVLDHSEIDSIDHLETYTDIGSNDVLQDDYDDDIYRLKPRKGIIQIRLDAFKRTRSARPADNIYKDGRIKIGYTYGLDYVPTDIKLATAKYTVADLVNSDSYGAMLPNEFDGVDASTYAKRVRNEADDIIEDYITEQGY